MVSPVGPGSPVSSLLVGGVVGDVRLIKPSTFRDVDQGQYLQSLPVWHVSFLLTNLDARLLDLFPVYRYLV